MGGKVWVVTHVVGGVVNGVLAFDCEDAARAPERLLAKEYELSPDDEGHLPWEETEDVDVKVDEFEIHSSVVEE